MELRNGGTASDWFFLAMTHWKLSNKELAHMFYDRAVSRTAKGAAQDEQFRRFQAEAGELLGIKKDN